ncbi:MAG: serine hydrolase [Cyanobacteriota bacterium]
MKRRSGQGGTQPLGSVPPEVGHRSQSGDRPNKHSSPRAGNALARSPRPMSPRASYSAQPPLNLRNVLDHSERSSAVGNGRRTTGRSGSPSLALIQPQTRQLAPRSHQPDPARRTDRSVALAPKPMGRSRATSRRARTYPLAPVSPLLYATRLIILGVGIGAIVGTSLSIWNPTMRAQETTTASLAASPTLASSPTPTPGFRGDLVPANPSSTIMKLRLGQPIAPLTTKLQSLVSQAGLSAGVFVVDLDTGDYVDVNGSTVYPAASTIKTPILVAFLQDVDRRRVRLDEFLTLQTIDITDGSGEVQFMEIGSQLSALDTATKMITISDNTATNMVIHKLGGLTALNSRFRDWGMSHTVLNNLLADLQGTNTTSARDLSLLLTAVSQGDLLSLRSRDRLLDIMRSTVNNNLLAATLGPDAKIAHKTGNIDSLSGDTGIVDMPNGKRYVITALVQRAGDAGAAAQLIQQISQATYQYFAQPPAAASPSAPPDATTNPAAPPSEAEALEPEASTPSPTQQPTPL